MAVHTYSTAGLDAGHKHNPAAVVGGIAPDSNHGRPAHNRCRRHKSFDHDPRSRTTSCRQTELNS